jgi:hypothetical protein
MTREPRGPCAYPTRIAPEMAQKLGQELLIDSDIIGLPHLHVMRLPETELTTTVMAMPSVLARGGS